jgi:hypothetical protein
MKTIKLTIGIIALIFVFSCGKKDDAKVEHNHDMHAMESKDSASGEQTIYYTCPMDSHKHVHASEAGKCPECGMTMVKGVVTSVDKMEYYGCPMETHSHIRSDNPGKCPECKMELKPMRLAKDSTSSASNMSSMNHDTACCSTDMAPKTSAKDCAPGASGCKSGAKGCSGM